MSVKTKFIALLTLIIGIGCTAPTKKEYTHIDGFVQGTTYSIIYSDSTDYKEQIEGLLDRFDYSLSIYNDSSLINAINDNLRDSIDYWFKECFSISSKVYSQTNGLFDPTVAPLIAAYGFARKNEQRSLDSIEIAQILTAVGFDKLKIENNRVIKQNPNTRIDFNAIAQGYSVDLVGEYFDYLGVENYMIEIGGEVYTRGVSARGDKWRIGIDTPEEGNNMPGANLTTVVELSNQGLATSGNYRKYIDLPSGEKVVHTIDPRNGHSVTHNLLSATIIAPTSALADGYATACMVGGLEWSKEFIKTHSELECYLVYSDTTGAMQVYSTLE